MPSQPAPAPRPAFLARVLCTSSVFVLVTALSGCGGSGTEDIVVAGDDCTYQGPTSFEPGPVTVALHLTSLGHNELAVVRLEPGHDYSELEGFLDQAADPVTNRPSWISEVVTIELKHEAGERIGDSELVTMSEGTYALICIDYWGFAVDGPSATLIGELTVASP